MGKFSPTIQQAISPELVFRPYRYSKPCIIVCSTDERNLYRLPQVYTILVSMIVGTNTYRKTESHALLDRRPGHSQRLIWR